ncbi:octaprenyl-diphosphate synthase [Desulfarculales bacterium]
MPTHDLPQQPPAPRPLLNPLSNQEVRARVLALAEPADQALTVNLTSHVPYIEEVSGYIIFSGGKRLRPVLFLLAARALGHEADPRHAAIFEYLHAATLLHDDVVDNAGLRRGRPAARVKYGNDTVILVGDFLFSKSYSLSVEVPDHRFVQALADCTTHMAEGQVLELLHTDDLDLSHQGYLKVIVTKTAVLLAAACQMGAIYAGASPETVRAFYDFGIELGIAFQMVDDALDYVGSEHEFGKPVGHDLEEGKITLPFIHARDHASPEMRQRLLKLTRQSRQEPTLLPEAQEIIRGQGGVEATFAWANHHAAQAQTALAPLLAQGGPNLDLQTMLGLAFYVVTRRT